MDFSDPSNNILMNAMELWDTYYLRNLFNDDFESVKSNLLNSSMSHIVQTY